MSTSTNTLNTNKAGLSLNDYKGGASTMCDGCGHDAISSQIIKAFYELGIEPHTVVKLSGIGCSSKTPAYFLGKSHAINAVHGRMPSVATGVNVANKNMKLIGVSGDGDSASIGLGQLCHLIRRNVQMVYIVENNGVYGLTKGQFSATADIGSTLKNGVVNDLPPIDICGLALELGCGFVARSFAGDPKQLLPLLKAALSYDGLAILDIISPCVTFNNHEGSTKSYKKAKESEIPLHELGFVPYFEQITIDYEPGTVTDVEMHDGSHLTLKKLDRNYEPFSRQNALNLVLEAKAKNEFLTGLLYIDNSRKSFTHILNTVDKPLSSLTESELRPDASVLNEIMEDLK